MVNNHCQPRHLERERRGDENKRTRAGTCGPAAVQLRSNFSQKGMKKSGINKTDWEKDIQKHDPKRATDKSVKNSGILPTLPWFQNHVKFFLLQIFAGYTSVKSNHCCHFTLNCTALVSGVLHLQYHTYILSYGYILRKIKCKLNVFSW